MFSKISKITALCSSGFVLAMAPLAPANAFHDDIFLRALAIDMCTDSPGFAALGYGNEYACIEGVYWDLLRSGSQR